MIYIAGYLVLYCFSVYWLQRDWRKDFNLSLGTFLLILLLSSFLIGILVFVFDIIKFVFRSLLDTDKIILKRYKS